MASLNHFEIVNNDIHISREGWKRIAETTYRKDYYDELTSVTWTRARGYLKNGKLGFLHRYIMEKWYGKDVLDKMTKDGWIVDHINNDGMDCRITNLEFLKKRYNTAKGQSFDVDKKNAQYDLVLNLFKDFNTGFYQMSLIFNKPAIHLIDPDGNIIDPIVMSFLYKSEYMVALLEAEKILSTYDSNGTIDLSHMSYCDVKIKKAEHIKLTEQEKYEIENEGRAFVERDGKLIMLSLPTVNLLESGYYPEWGANLRKQNIESEEQ